MWIHRRTTLMGISSAFLAVAPKCPICFFAYFGIFGVATAPASVYRVWLPPLTAIWLTLTVGMICFQRGGKRRYGPVFLGLVAAFAVFAGRFIVDYQPLACLGIAALVIAVLWRTRSRESAAPESCQQCDEIPLKTTSRI
jgi:hypothetical protein